MPRDLGPGSSPRTGKAARSGTTEEFILPDDRLEEIRELVLIDVREATSGYGGPSAKLLELLRQVIEEAGHDHFDQILNEKDDYIDDLEADLEDLRDVPEEYDAAVRELLETAGIRVYSHEGREEIAAHLKQVAWRLRRRT